MITTETKEKNLPIYRPDITLPEICQAEGPSLVRKMIPCFRLPDVIFEDQYNSKGKLVKKGNNHFSDPQFTFVYGLNVRTPRINSILPFSTTYIYDKSKGEGTIRDDFKISEITYKVPEFTDQYYIRELFLYATVKEVEGKLTVDADDIVILSLTTEEEIKISEMKQAICQDGSFFRRHVTELCIRERIYLWLTSEDYNVNKAGVALSNFIAISDDYDAIAKHIIPHRLDFVNLLFLIKARHLFDAEIAQRKTAISSAKAAIMSRNMSHNLGSHVMAYLKQHLNSVQDMVRDNVLASLFTSQDDLTSSDGLRKWFVRYEKFIKEQQQGLGEVALPFLVGLGKFISYLQERQDFIATIATDYVPYFSTVNFKDFVYDELNPDLRYERHRDRIGLQPDNILLGNIARSEGLARSTNPTKNKKMADIIIKYRNFNGKPVAQLIDSDPRKKALSDMRNFMVYLPGGVVGRQAIFSIVENIIRNAAKHGKWGDEGNKSLELTFDRFYIEQFKDGTMQEDCVPIGDDSFVEFFKKYYAAASDINDLCVITLTDNIPFELAHSKLEDCKNLESIRNALIEPYIDNTSVEMLQTNKGIKEMRISAAWMRGIDDDVKINPLYITPDFDRKQLDKEHSNPEDHWIHVKPITPPKPKKPGKNASLEEKSNYNRKIEKYNNEFLKFKEEKKNFVYKYWKNGQWINHAPILMARACSNSSDENYHLQYVFCLPRPKDVAIILSNKKYSSLLKTKKVLNWFSQNSWDLFSVDKFIGAKNKSYEFILLSDEIIKEETNLIRQISPKRVFCQDDIKDIVIIDDTLLSTKFKNFYSIRLELYKMLCKFNSESDIIIISDEKTSKPEDNEGDNLTNVIIQDGAYKGKYLYRTHNDTENLFTDYLKNSEENTVFVEGITGNNSTDRLVRNDRIDELWMYKHLHAMKTSIGIFDERIFAKIFKKDEADIRLAQLPFDELKKQLRETTIDDKIKKSIRAAKTEDDLNKAIGRDARIILGDYMSIVYEKKGISIFNLLKTKDGLDIYGFDNIIWDEKEIKCFGKIAKVGEITQKDGQIIVSNPHNLRFDYLSIHQGLLDKVYEQFDIRHDAFSKHKFTKAFYEAFCNDSEVLLYQDEKIKDNNGITQTVYYLPNLRIHSGRSKPSFADMPQHQPFIQYAAIEHAVMDCKYSLVELLDFARYE